MLSSIKEKWGIYIFQIIFTFILVQVLAREGLRLFLENDSLISQLTISLTLSIRGQELIYPNLDFFSLLFSPDLFLQEVVRVLLTLNVSVLVSIFLNLFLERGKSSIITDPMRRVAREFIDVLATIFVFIAAELLFGYIELGRTSVDTIPKSIFYLGMFVTLLVIRMLLNYFLYKTTGTEVMLLLSNMTGVPLWFVGTIVPFFRILISIVFGLLETVIKLIMCIFIYYTFFYFEFQFILYLFLGWIILKLLETLQLSLYSNMI